MDTIIHAMDTIIHAMDTIIHAMDTIIHAMDTIIHAMDTIPSDLNENCSALQYSKTEISQEILECNSRSAGRKTNKSHTGQG